MSRSSKGSTSRRVRERENAFIATLETERLELSAGSDLGAIVLSRDPVKVFDDVDLMKKSRVIDFFCAVRLYPYPRGKRFDPETVMEMPKELQEPVAG